MSSIVLGKSDSYINIGTARAWREHLLNHTFSAWIKTTCQLPACLVSLTNEAHEVFSVEINITTHPSRDATQIAHKYQHAPPTRFLHSAGSRWQRAPIPKTLRPVKVVGTQGALLGNLAGGLRISVRDDNGNKIVAESPLPILADGRWHFLQVTVDGSEVLVQVDANKTSVVYPHRDHSLRPVDWSNVGERVVYPSHDLIAARFSASDKQVRDHYCGLLADVAVEIGHPGGHKLHWWVTDFAKGTIVWDRGSGAKQHSLGLHLNLCSCGWETADFPATSLLLNGIEGRVAEVPALTEDVLEAMATAGSTNSTQPTPQGITSLTPPPMLNVAAFESTEHMTGTSVVIVPSSPAGISLQLMSPGSVLTPSSGNGANHSSSGGDNEPHAPVSQTMNREYFERVKKEEGRQPVSFAMWICTRDRDPAIVFTAPFLSPVHMVLNLDCKPSVALVNGLDAFVSQCDVTDGKWHHLRWIIDPKTGASLFLDGALAAWQYVSLHVDEEGGPLRGKSSPGAGNVDGADVSANASFSDFASQSNVASRSRSRYVQHAQTAASQRSEMEESLRRRSIETSKLNLHSERKSLTEKSSEEEADEFGSGKLQGKESWRKARSRTSIAFLDNNALPKPSGAASFRRIASVGQLSSASTQAAPSTSGFAADEDELFGDLIQELEEADERVAASGVFNAASDETPMSARSRSNSPSSAPQGSIGGGLSTTLSQHFMFLSIKKRREIIRTLTEMVRSRSSKSPNTNGKNSFSCLSPSQPLSEDDPAFVKCFTMGRLFSGELREVVVRLGHYAFTWRFDIGTGRTVEAERRVNNGKFTTGDRQSGSATPGGQSLFGLPTPTHGSRFSVYEEEDELAAIDCSMQLSGRTTVFPKTVLPYSTALLDDGTCLDLGSVRVPLLPQSTGVDVDFYVRLGRAYGHVLVVEGVCIIELQPNRVNVLLVGTITSALSAATLLHHADIDPAILSDSTTPRLMCNYQDTSVFEDRFWHHIRLIIPVLGSSENVQMTIDEIPSELSQSLVLEQFPGNGVLQTESSSPRKSRAFSHGSRRGTVLQKQANPNNNEVSTNGGASLLGFSTFSASDTSFSLPVPGVSLQITTETPMSTKSRISTTIKDTYAKIRHLLLLPRCADTAPASPQAAHDVRLAPIVCGGNGFVGSVCQLRMLINGIEHQWALDDASRSSIGRLPPQLDERFLSHYKMEVNPNSIAALVPSTPSNMQCEVDGDEHRHWQNTTLPSRALHFDGHSSFVSSVNLKSNFHMSQLKHFAVSLWIKAGSMADPTVALSSGCVLSVHDIKKPTTESSCGIFTHTRVDEHTSPRKRMLAPYITTFLLVDSCARALCVETTYDIYDGLWHKLQWVVYDSEVNETHVFVDDIAVPIRVVCGDQPREFTCRNPVLNLGARNEGDNDVNDFFVGEIRNFCFAREVGDNILSWPMTEGSGDVLNDVYQRVSGCAWAPEWVFTPFPPMTPILRDDSIVEFSPVSDMESAAKENPIWFSFALKSNSTATGSVWSIVSADRCVLGSLIANEGGDHERRFNEPGTHILKFQRVVRKEVTTITSTAAQRATSPIVLAGLTSPFSKSSVSSGPLLSPQMLPSAAPFADDLLASSTMLAPPSELDDDLRSVPSTSMKTPHRRRKIARRAELKQLLQRQKLDADEITAMSTSGFDGLAISMKRSSTNHNARIATILEERAYQFHYKELCDGKWHNITIRLSPDPSDPAMVCVDELDVRASHLFTTNLRELKDGIVEELARMPVTNASRVRDRTAIEVLRDEICWASVVLGKSSVTSTTALHCCVRNFAVLTSSPEGGGLRKELLFVPFASTTDMLVTNVPRDVAATGLTWELSVPPKSSIALSSDSYILVPPLARLNLKSFEVTFQIRAITTKPSCIVEFGSVEKGYFCIMLNQDAFGEDTPNSLRVCLCDKDGRELHASCFLSEEEFDPAARAKSLRPIEDDRWHNITLRVLDSAQNNVMFEVDGIVPQIRYANCGSPEHYLPLTEGGTIGALLDALFPRYSLHGSVKNFCVSSLLNSEEVYLDPSVELRRERLVFYEATSGFASILTDRSGNRNHAMAVRPNWKTDIQTSWSPMEVPSKASDIFGSSYLTVTRWSNNPSDHIEKNPASDEVIMDDFPEDGWSAGAKGPQWISIDFGSTHTIYGVEVDVLRATTSKHEIYISHSNLSKSLTFHHNEDPGDSPVPQAFLLESVCLRPSSPKTIRVKLTHPLHGIRWLRVATVESAVPAGYNGIRIIAARASEVAVRKYSVSESLGKTLSNVAARSQSGPMISMFPDSFVPSRVVPSEMVTKQTAAIAIKKQKSNIAWGGEDVEASPWGVVSAFSSSSLKQSPTGRSHRSASRVHIDDPMNPPSPSSPLNRSQSTIDAELVQNERLQLMRKTSETRMKELKLIFYTQDVERTGMISLAAFIVVFKKLDVTGLLSEEQVLSFLRDAGVLDSNVTFEQFVKVISHLETW
ncbi:Hypothetical protein, putative [Bodo saltans]|uniref:Laminin G domain-containing protein n=1 Tax=Bodo saltans TaxID=75058 RepID=A0A0S4JQM4_BODSA|nr:Hypothetical protein, putative [Bodo saltans]|eukprot:CUG93830.1 Hypothetical protein, putative [Bodo saltans]